MRRALLLFLIWSFVFAGSTLLSGCTLGPKEINRGRQQYNEAVQKSFREELLLNLVRLRYRETPEFLSVGGIAAQYTFDGRATGSLSLPNAQGKSGSLFGGLSRTERPTISYVPARGEAFQKGLLAPIDLVSLELLTRTGWSWERILRTSVQYINRVDNATSAGGPTPARKPDYEEFHYLARLLRELQNQRTVELVRSKRAGSPKLLPVARDKLDGDFVISAINEGYSFEETDEGLALVKSEQFLALVIHPEAKQSGALQELSQMLDLKVDYSSVEPAVYEVNAANSGWIQSTYADATLRLPTLAGPEGSPFQTCDPDYIPALRDDLIVSTRSLLEVMFYLSHGTVVPIEHQRQGLVTQTLDFDGHPFDWADMLGDMFTVRVCKHRPKHAAVAVPYRDFWFYIDDRDRDSLATFSLLVELFGIQVRAGGGGGFLYTLGI